jgi:hypothetical protein
MCPVTAFMSTGHQPVNFSAESPDEKPHSLSRRLSLEKWLGSIAGGHPVVRVPT